MPSPEIEKNGAHKLTQKFSDISGLKLRVLTVSEAKNADKLINNTFPKFFHKTSSSNCSSTLNHGTSLPCIEYFQY